MLFSTIVMLVVLSGCALSSLSSVLGMADGQPPIDVTAQIGAENESNKVKVESDTSTKVEQVGGNFNNTTTINMTWWMIAIVWLSGILVTPANLVKLFRRD